jgi:transposase-like protein
VQRYAPELDERIRRELKPTNGSWRTDETYVRVAGRWTYLYRAVDSTGATIDFLLSETRDLTSARRFFQKALAAPGHPRPRVINVDGNPPTRPLSRSLNRSASLAEGAAVALFPISITLSSRITARLSDASTLVWDSAPLMAHNGRYKATKQCT